MEYIAKWKWLLKNFKDIEKSSWYKIQESRIQNHTNFIFSIFTAKNIYTQTQEKTQNETYQKDNSSYLYFPIYTQLCSCPYVPSFLH